MSLNVETTRQLLQDFDFQTLFREELGWNNPKSKTATPFHVKEEVFYRKAIAELSGASVFEITSDGGSIPDPKTRHLISTEIQKLNFEHILIFLDKKPNQDNSKATQSVWRWLKKQNKKSLPREHYFSVGQTGDAFISKLSGLLVDLGEIENDITITDVAKKIQNALDIERVTKRFFKDYQQQFIEFLPLIEGIDNEADKRWYASVILNRLMFIYFLQEKGFINNGDRDYLYSKLKETKKEFGKNKYFSEFLKPLFFEGFAKPETERSAATNKLLGKIKYLNGGLFLKHKIEEKYPKIAIPDVAFENLLKSDEPKGLFEQFSWSLDDTPGGKDDEINPDVLGYIFEKYINQKAFGAYYTRTEITEYLCEQTVYKLILDAVNEPAIDPELLKKAGLDKGPKPKHFDTVEELLINLDAATCRKLIYGDNAVLPNLSLLDPACGSGAFLVAAMKTLINVYASILGRIDFLGDKKLIEWKKEIEKEHPSINYYIKKKIITNNLYGVDIMEEATEIAKLRLFLALVSSAQTVDQLEPLPNIDFNIMSGNSLIGMMRVDPNQFNKHITPTSKKTGGKSLKDKNLFEPGVIMGNLFAEEHAKGYQQLINEKEAAVNAYKNAQNLGLDELQALRNDIQKQEREANNILNQLLVEEFNSLGIRYEELDWDEKKNKEIVKSKRPVTIDDIKLLEPFNWGYEFSEIFRKKNGFDAIITNPPWEIFKPQAKEFFAEHSSSVKKNTMSIKEFEREQLKLLKQPDIKKEWITFLSKFPHQSQYFRSASQYKNQVSIVNGKKAGSDINLYKLFVEQCYNLLKDKGYCGIVIPSGIYTDLGTKQLRELFLNKAQIANLISLSNERTIFENVMHNFKFCLLTYKKDNPKDYFKASFRIYVHEAVWPKELDTFLNADEFKLKIPTQVVKQFAPISLSIMEYKDETDLSIARKLIAFPMLGEIMEDNWNFKLSSEYHMTNDSYLFKENPGNGRLVLYEGKMIHQFTHLFSTAQYWIVEKEGRKALLPKGLRDKGEKLEYQDYRLGTRAIGGSANERGLIATVVPKNVFCANSILVSTNKSVINPVSNTEKLLLLGFLNSYVVDYCIRQMVATNINMFYIYQLHIPRLKSSDRWFATIVEKAAKLICTTEEFSDLWEEVTKKKWSKNIAVTDEGERNKIRAELDGIIANIYGLTEKEFIYVLSTFPVVPIQQKQAALDNFKKIAPQFTLINGSVVDYMSLINKGESPKLEFKSTLRVDVKTSKPEKFIEHSALKTLAAFLNSDGGTLLIGVEDNKNILGLDLDFNSFSKPDKLDEFQKHFDNLIQKTLGNRYQRYLDVDFPEVEGKTICSVSIKEKSSEPVYLIDETGNEKFFIRRQASTVDLKMGEANKYIKDHWK